MHVVKGDTKGRRSQPIDKELNLRGNHAHRDISVRNANASYGSPSNRARLLGFFSMMAHIPHAASIIRYSKPTPA
jgi:hypothetical protein